jgi:hypothetical protein
LIDTLYAMKWQVSQLHLLYRMINVDDQEGVTFE